MLSGRGFSSGYIYKRELDSRAGPQWHCELSVVYFLLLLETSTQRKELYNSFYISAMKSLNRTGLQVGMSDYRDKNMSYYRQK